MHLVGFVIRTLHLFFKENKNSHKYIRQQSTPVTVRIVTTFTQTGRHKIKKPHKRNIKKILYFNCYIKTIMTCKICKTSQI